MSGPPSGRAVRVLLVDDYPAVREVLARALRLCGLEVWAAAGGAEALALCRRHPGGVDVALIDLLMPGLDGPQTLAALRRLDPALPALFLSGDPGRLTAGDLAAMGVAAAVGKPVADFDALARRLRDAAGSRPGRGGPHLYPGPGAAGRVMEGERS